MVSVIFRNPAAGGRRRQIATIDQYSYFGAIEHFAFEDLSLSEVFRKATGASVGQAEAEHAAATRVGGGRVSAGGGRVSGRSAAGAGR